MTVRPDGPERLSISGADLWRQCPKKWHGEHILGIKEPAGIAADIGTAAHAVLEDLCALPPEQRTITEAAKRRHLITEALPDPEHRPARRAAWAHVTRALNVPVVVHGNVLSREMKLDTTLGSTPFIGYLDRADTKRDDTVRIIDYKTGKYPARDDWAVGKVRQLYTYAAGFEALNPGVDVSEVVIVWTVNGRATVKPVYQDDLVQAVDELNEVWVEIRTAIDQQEFPANPGPLCSWCQFAPQCHEGQLAIKKRSRQRGKSLGPHAPAALEALERPADAPALPGL